MNEHIATSSAPAANGRPTTVHAPSVCIAADLLTVFVSIGDPHADLDAAATSIRVALQAEGLLQIPENDAICESITGACEPGEDLADHALITGRAPVEPRHGRLVWTRDYFASGFTLDEERDLMDYRERAEQRAVEAGEVLCHLTLPRNGEPGEDVFGNKIPVEKPHKERLRAGKGVRIEEGADDVNALIAETSGRLRLTNGTLTIDEVYTIKGNVNLETGNVRHKGALIVTGDVEAGCRIEVEGDVTIKGLVEPSDIVCGGNLVVGGGIVGSDGHAIAAAGDVVAKYLNEVHLTAGGDVRIHSQIDHSHVHARGAVRISQGRIAGGEVIALRGIEVGHAGAEGSTGTLLVAGVDWETDRQVETQRDLCARLQDKRKQVAGALSRAAQRLDCLTPAEKQAVAQLRTKLLQIDSALQFEARQIEEKTAEVRRRAVFEIKVLRGIQAGTAFRLGGSRHKVTRSVDKPRLVALRRDKVRILPFNEELV